MRPKSRCQVKKWKLFVLFNTAGEKPDRKIHTRKLEAVANSPKWNLIEDNIRPNKELLLNKTNVRANSDIARGSSETTMCQFYARDGFMSVPIYKAKY